MRQPPALAASKELTLDAQGVGTLVEGSLELPTLPLIAQRLLVTLSDPYATIHDAAKLVEGDPGLSVRLLRLANTPIYGRERRIGSVQQAISLIGFEEVRNIVIAMASRALYEGLDVRGMELWRHSVATAMACQVLSARYEPRLRRLAYISGQMHDIGRVVMLRRDPKKYGMLGRLSGDRGIVAAERELYGFSHCDAGAYAVRRWSLPEVIERVALHHHGFAKVGVAGEAWALLNACVIVGDALAQTLDDERESAPRAWELDVEPSLRLLNIPMADVPPMVEALASACDEAEPGLFN